jgi:CBS domain containing-hemolysin-like protein
VGILTIEDIVEELVGEIWDEHDEVVEPVREKGDGTFLVLGNSSLDDMFDFFKTPGDDRGAVSNTTVANWVMETIGGVPRTGDEFSYKNLRVRVSRVIRHRVIEVTVTPMEGENAGEGADGKA